MFSRLPLLLVAIGLFATSTLQAAPPRVKFKQDSFTFTAKVNQLFDLDLKTLLSDPGSGNLNWSIPQGKPGWLTLDSAKAKLSGTPLPPDLGKKAFTLFVQDGEMGASTRTEITVIGPPEWTKPNIDLGIQNEGTAMTPFDLKPFVTNSAGGAISFSSPNLKPWMTLSADGVLSGTPKRADVGDYSGVIFVVTGVGGSAQATGFGKVLKTITPPKWKGNPLALEDAFEDSAYSRNIVEFVDNFEKTELKFEKVTGPAWVSVSSAGVVIGTPKKPDLGGVNLTVKFKTTIDGTEYTANTTFQFKVIHVNHAPTWKSNPLVLPNGLTKVLYSQDLSKSASDIDDGDVLTFKKLSGPAWVSIGTNGALQGTPTIADLGLNKISVQVSDQLGLTADTEVQITVIKSNEPPVWTTKPVVLPKAKEDQAYMADLTTFTKDPDNDPITFTVLSGPTWAKISSTGTLSGTPKADDVGISKWVVQISDNISGNDTTDVMIEVEHVNHTPEWLLNPIKITTKEKTLTTANISVYAKDVDKGDKLSFQLLAGGPAWGTLSQDGQFSGTPPTSAIGLNVFNVRVSDQVGAFADAKLEITVQNVNDKPYWTQNPVVLPNGPEQVLYNSTVATFAKDDDAGDVLTFSKVSGPAWLTVNSDGSVTGTPKRADVGLNTFQMRVTDMAGEFALATVQITIDKVNQAPRWRQDPILMSDATEDKNYAFDLSQYATDDDGDTLTFSKVSGPDWVVIAANGMVSGVPKRADVGPFTIVVKVSDGKLSADATGKGKVNKVNKPPVISAEIPTVIMKERETFNLALAQYVTDPDGDAMTFSMSAPPPWVTFFADGNVTLKPLFKEIGDHMFTFNVSDGSLSTQGTFRVRVLRNPRPPVWLESPIKYEAKTNELFNGTLVGKAIDLDNLPLKFSKKTGNAWLVVNPDGTMSGTPKDSDLGENTFTVAACNDVLCADAQVIITVKPGIQKDVTQIDKAVPGAPTENLWVVDTSNNCAELTQSLRNNVKFFFEELNKAQVKSTGLYLSADARAFDGMPVKSATSQWFMLNSDANVVKDFQWRMDKGYENNSRFPERCGGGNCLNSPIWSMFRLYGRAPTDFDFYHQGYFTAGVPMDAMIVTQQRDHYKYYAQNKPQKNWTPSEYAANFIQFADKEKQSYRVSAIAPECPGLISEEGSWAGPENAYRVIVQKTRGTYYAVQNCNYTIKPDLIDYAKKVIFRAYVHAKGRILLSKKPTDLKTLKVTIGGVELLGNTGGADDKWRYDAATNEVVLYWHLIDQGQLKPGDQIAIEYRVS